jgi:hypothetical protein
MFKGVILCNGGAVYPMYLSISEAESSVKFSSFHLGFININVWILDIYESVVDFLFLQYIEYGPEEQVLRSIFPLFGNLFLDFYI